MGLNTHLGNSGFYSNTALVEQEMQYLGINFLEAPLLGFILAFMVRFYNTDISNKTGYVFRENENLISYLFMSVVVSLFIGMMVSA